MKIIVWNKETDEPEAVDMDKEQLLDWFTGDAPTNEVVCPACKIAFFSPFDKTYIQRHGMCYQCADDKHGTQALIWADEIWESM